VGLTNAVDRRCFNKTNSSEALACSNSTPDASYYVSHRSAGSAASKARLVRSYFCLGHFAVSVNACCVCIAVLALPLGLAIEGLSSKSPWWVPSTTVLAVGLLLRSWPYLCGFILPMRWGPWAWMESKDTFYINTCCSDQSTNEQQQSATASTVHFMHHSEKLIVLLDRGYLTDLRCVLELATFCKIHKDTEKAQREGATGIVISAWCFALFDSTSSPYIYCLNSEVASPFT
jgi:hypothetical protein